MNGEEDTRRLVQNFKATSVIGMSSSIFLIIPDCIAHSILRNWLSVVAVAIRRTVGRLVLQSGSGMKTSLFLTLPDVIVLEILMNWLKLADVGHVDSAYCSVVARPQFLTLLSAFRVFSDRKAINSAKEYHILVWTVKRSIKVKGFTITSKVAADNNLQDALFAISGSSVQWIVLDEIDCTNKQIKVIERAAKVCPNTETLHIFYSYKASSFYDECLPLLTQAFQRLHTLHIQNTALSSKGIAKVLEHCRILRYLHLQSLLSPLPVEVALPSLEQFSAMDCNVPEAVLFAIAANCPRMKHMEIFRDKDYAISNEAVQAILQGCPLLQYTDVEYARGLSHELRVELARRRNFTILMFCYVAWVDANPERCAEILRVSPSLQELIVSSCPWLTDDVLAVCAQHCKSLECLVLYDCSDVTVTGILAITAPGNKLNKVIVRNCAGLGDEAVLAVAQRCPHLKVFGSPPQVSSEVIVTLAKGCPLLEVVYVWHTNADDAALVALCLHCPLLRTLDMFCCKDVTLQAKAAMRAQYPKLDNRL